VASVSNPTASLWTVPIQQAVAQEGDAKPLRLPTVRASAPRFGGAAMYYLSSLGTGDGIWRFQDGKTDEVWKGSDGAIFETPAPSGDGSRLAMVVKQNGVSQLRVGKADGTAFQMISAGIDLPSGRGGVSWSPDGKWIVCAGSDTNGQGLFKIPVDGGPAVRIVKGIAGNPIWSPDGGLIIYVGEFVSSQVQLRGVRPDGTPVPLPEIRVSSGGERVRFLPNGKGMVYMQGPIGSQDFWLFDPATERSRRLTQLANTARMRTFDVTPDGSQIVFDRIRDHSDIVMIDLPAKR